MHRCGKPRFKRNGTKEKNHKVIDRLSIREFENVFVHIHLLQVGLDLMSMSDHWSVHCWLHFTFEYVGMLSYQSTSSNTSKHVRKTDVLTMKKRKKRAEGMWKEEWRRKEKNSCACRAFSGRLYAAFKNGDWNPGASCVMQGFLSVGNNSVEMHCDAGLPIVILIGEEHRWRTLYPIQ